MDFSDKVQLRNLITKLITDGSIEGIGAVNTKSIGGSWESEFTDKFVRHIQGEQAKFPKELGTIQIQKFGTADESRTGADVRFMWEDPSKKAHFILYLQIKTLYKGYTHYCRAIKKTPEKSEEQNWKECDKVYFDMKYKSTAEGDYNGQYQAIRLQKMLSDAENDPKHQTTMAAWLVFESPGKVTGGDMSRYAYLQPIDAVQIAIKGYDGKKHPQLEPGDLDHLTGDEFMKAWKGTYDITRQPAEFTSFMKNYIRD